MHKERVLQPYNYQNSLLYLIAIEKKSLFKTGWNFTSWRIKTETVAAGKKQNKGLLLQHWSAAIDFLVCWRYIFMFFKVYILYQSATMVKQTVMDSCYYCICGWIRLRPQSLKRRCRWLLHFMKTLIQQSLIRLYKNFFEVFHFFR